MADVLSTLPRRRSVLSLNHDWNSLGCLIIVTPNWRDWLLRWLDFHRNIAYCTTRKNTSWLSLPVKHRCYIYCTRRKNTSWLSLAVKNVQLTCWLSGGFWQQSDKRRNCSVFEGRFFHSSVMPLFTFIDISALYCWYVFKVVWCRLFFVYVWKG